MVHIRRSVARGHFDHGWLDTHHTFSFADYVDPRHVGFRALRVLNEDRVAPGAGFGMHPHRDMEIVTYVLEGELTHRDSMGHQGVIRAGELQRITAGTGIEHSEFNASTTEPVHFYQIWLRPERSGLEPSYEHKVFPDPQPPAMWRLAASPDGRDGSLTIRQDARIALARLDSGDLLPFTVDPGRHLWIQVLRGAVSLGDADLSAGDGVAISDESAVALVARTATEVLLLDLS